MAVELPYDKEREFCVKKVICFRRFRTECRINNKLLYYCRFLFRKCCNIYLDNLACSQAMD